MELATQDVNEATGAAVRVRGLVQGVGFRPTVWRLANECGLRGDVCNDAEGVLIRIWGEAGARRRFLQRLQREVPPLARIDALESEPLEAPPPKTAFRILASRAGEVHTGVAADAATCARCLADVNEAGNRRHRYPFTNCTHCGPRLSIVRRIPYDRANTSMDAFPMCPACRREYDDPADRRFHAQPNACPDCGPRLWLEAADGRRIDGDPLVTARRWLSDGCIVAIKGIGGIHLAVDATSGEAVERLRHRKRRYRKPFALMARDPAVIRRYCALSDGEVDLLHSPAAPIVLLRRSGRERVAEAVAPGHCCLGFMLPYSPLHHLLMAELDNPIVLTSGNRSDEPQCIGNDQARERLSGIADFLLLHDRAIVNRLDDSVVRVIGGKPVPVRRARGYAPAPLRLPAGFEAAPPLLAFGAEMKNTFCFLRDGEAILSQHLGDLENAAAHRAYTDTLALYEGLFEHRPAVLATDAHPEYLPSKLGREWAEANGGRLLEVQHHHAHIAACLADNGVAPDAPPVLGIALDGLGYGDDGSLWGGEFLLADYRGYRRLASLAPLPMPGGTGAIRQPWRMAYAHLRRLDDWRDIGNECARLPFFRDLADRPLGTLDRMMEAGFNSPATSASGRLFDAVSAVLGLCSEASYDGQAAIELEAAVDTEALSAARGYPFAIREYAGLSRLDPAPMWRALLRDLRDGVANGVAAARFHAGLALALVRMIEHLGERRGDAWVGRVALSGGVFQNAVLSELLTPMLENRGLEVLRHRQVPANDGGLSLGQAVVAAARSIRPTGGTDPCA